MKIKISKFDYENLILFRKDLSTAQYTMDAYLNSDMWPHEAVALGERWEDLVASKNQTVMGGSDEQYRQRKELVDLVYEVADASDSEK